MAAYEQESLAIAIAAKQLVHTAILFDTLHEQERFVSWQDYETLVEDDSDTVFEIEEQSIQFVGDLSAPNWTSVMLHRNLKPLTQKLFGFKFSPFPQLNNEEDDQLDMHICLMPTIEIGPKLAEFLIKSHYLFATFQMPVERDEEHTEFWFGASLAFNNVFTSQKRIELNEQQGVAAQLKALIGELDQLDVMCKMGGSFSPYIKLLDDI